MEAFLVALSSVWADSGFSALTSGHVIMIVVGLVLLYMAIGKGFEPLLLSPIAFGCILANIPKNGFLIHFLILTFLFKSVISMLLLLRCN